MSREIKFRCWDIENKMFLVNHSYPIGSDYRMMLDIETGVFDACGANGGDYDTEPSIRFQNRKVVAQQFTGLYDKNEKPIYEGDVVKVGSQKWFDKNYFSIEEVTFSHSGVRFGNKIPYGEVYAGEVSGQEVNYYDTFEVIGNIFENSDLIKGGNK